MRSALGFKWLAWLGGLWIPAFAGMTGGRMGEGICWLGFALGFKWLAWLGASGFPPPLPRG